MKPDHAAGSRPVAPDFPSGDSSATSTAEIRIIRPRSGWSPINFAELLQYRDLLFFLAWRDIKVRYKQTALGAAWAVVQPLMNMVILTIIFGRFGRMAEHSSAPYLLLTFSAAVPWAFFSASLTQTGNSLIDSKNLVTKVYFPRLIIPLSTIFGALLDFAIALAVLIVFVFLFGIAPHASVALLPVFILLMVMSSVAVGIWLSALNVEFRDVRYTIPFLTQFWFLASPVGYSSNIVPNSWRAIYALNPMAGVIEGFRWALLGTNPPRAGMLVSSSLMITGFLIGGLYYFRRVERNFADVI